MNYNEMGIVMPEEKEKLKAVDAALPRCLFT